MEKTVASNHLQHQGRPLTCLQVINLRHIISRDFPLTPRVERNLQGIDAESKFRYVRFRRTRAFARLARTRTWVTIDAHEMGNTISSFHYNAQRDSTIESIGAGIARRAQ